MVANRGRPVTVLACLFAALLLVLAGCTSGPAPRSGGNAGAGGAPVAYREPVRLSSNDGVLEVRLVGPPGHGRARHRRGAGLELPASSATR